jgi:hypothetical protein
LAINHGQDGQKRMSDESSANSALRILVGSITDATKNLMLTAETCGQDLGNICLWDGYCIFVLFNIASKMLGITLATLWRSDSSAGSAYT